MEVLPTAELARRAAGGDGAAFVRVYDRYSAEVLAAARGATGSPEAAAAATRIAFLRMLRRPPALGVPDDHVSELIRALALGAAVEGSAPDHDTGPLPADWLRRQTVVDAGQRFDEDWSLHLGGGAAPEPAEAPAERVVAAVPLPISSPKPVRGFTAFVAELPLRAAGVVVIGLAAATFGAAVVRMQSDNPRGATETAAAAGEAGTATAAPSTPRARAAAGLGATRVVARTRPARRP